MMFMMEFIIICSEATTRPKGFSATRDPDDVTCEGELRFSTKYYYILDIREDVRINIHIML